MGDHLAFMKAIIERIDDDLPRLVMADWLEEHGQDERAEFVRVQCEIARLGVVGEELIRAAQRNDLPGMYDAAVTENRRDALRRRERELLAEEYPVAGSTYPAIRWADWAEGCRAGYCLNLYTGIPLCPPNVAVEFSRGFVSEITCTADDWLGGPCPGCIEPGEDDDGDPRCRLCSGSGRAPGLAETIAWRPGWTVCAICGDKPTEGGHCSHHQTRVSRPCPPGAQPVERVRLTTWPEGEDWVALRYVQGDSGYKHERWPGIWFELPADALPAQHPPRSSSTRS